MARLPKPCSPLEQLCLDAIAYLHCMERPPIAEVDICRYVRVRNRWAWRWRVRHALTGLMGRGYVTTMAARGTGTAYRWAT